MSKNRLLFLLLTLLTVSLGARAELVQIGEGTSTNGYFPVYTYYNYSLSQQIYTADEIGRAGYINSIAFHSSKEVTRNLDIYLFHTTKSSFEDNTDWAPTTGAELVFSGEVTFSANAWTTIDFDAPFDYDGTSNLVVMADDNTGDYVSSPNFLVFSAAAQGIRIFSDGTDYNPSEYGPGKSGSRANVKNQIILDITNELPSCSKPTGLTVSSVEARSAIASWSSEADAFDLRYKADGAADYTLVEGLTTTQYTLDGLTPETKYLVSVRTLCSATDQSAWTNDLSFTTAVSCAAPTGWDTSAITMEPFQLGFGWVAGNPDQSAWEVAYIEDTGFATTPTVDESWTTEIVNSTNYTATGLKEQTRYWFAVRAYCGGDDYSKWLGPAYLETTERYPAPTGLAATPAATEAEVSWTAGRDETQWNLRYRPAAPGLDFEDGLGGWTAVTNGAGSGWSYLDPSSAGIEAHGGSKVGISQSYTSSAVNADNWLISPLVDLGGTLSYWVMDDGYYHDYYAIMISTRGNDPDDFTLLYEPGNASSTWQQVEVDLSAYAGKQGYIAFRHVDYDQDYLLLDDIQILPAEEQPWVEVKGTADNPYTIKGLTPETDYEVQVQAVYGDGDDEVSEWTSSTRFTTTTSTAPVTDVVAENISYTTADIDWKVNGTERQWNLRYRLADNSAEDFENGLGEWTSVVNGEGTGWQTVDLTTSFSGNLSAHSGKMVAMSRSWANDAINADNWLISPEVDLGGTFSYWVMDDGEYHEAYTVMISTRGTEPDDFTLLYDPGYATDSWQQVEIDLSAYKGKKGYIAFHHVDYDQDFLFIDDVQFVSPDAEEKPWTEVDGLTEKPYTIEDLTPGTEYEVQVQSVYTGGTTSDWSASTYFSTLSSIVLLDNDYDQPEGQKNTDILAANLGKTVDFTISGRTLYKDGSWNTIVLPFELSLEELENTPLAGATIKWVSPNSTVEGTHVTLDLVDEDEKFYSDYPYFVKWDEGEDIVDPTFQAVTITGSEDPFQVMNYDYTIYSVCQYSSLMMLPPEELTEDDDVLIYYLSSDNKLRYTGKQRLLNAFRHAFVFRATDVDATALDFTLNFDDGSSTTGIVEVDGAPRKGNAPEGYYNLQGMKLDKAPRQKGIYITNGKKIIVK